MPAPQAQQTSHNNPIRRKVRHPFCGRPDQPHFDEGPRNISKNYANDLYTFKRINAQNNVLGISNQSLNGSLINQNEKQGLKAEILNVLERNSQMLIMLNDIDSSIANANDNIDCQVQEENESVGSGSAGSGRLSRLSRLSDIPSVSSQMSSNIYQDSQYLVTRHQTFQPSVKQQQKVINDTSLSFKKINKPTTYPPQ